MSLEFSNTTTKKGIIQEIESECGFNDGDISGNTTLLKKFTTGVNLAFDDFLMLALQASGTWQFDDSNQTDYPAIMTNLVSGQRDYAFTTDQNGNLILDIYKVLILPSATATIYEEIDPVDETVNVEIVDGSNTAGVPYEYGKMANGVLLNAVPNYNATNGLKILINREASYFVYTDTTKKPGVPGILHRYFVVKPSMDYARRYLTNDAYTKLANEVTKLEGEIVKYFSRREKDVRKVMRPRITPFI